MVFMSEGRQVLAGDAILSGAATIDRNEGDRNENDRNENARSESERSQDEVLEALVRQHSRLVYRIAYAVLRRHHDAEDAAQETFMRVLRYSSKLAAVENSKMWLARIAWRVAVDRSRRNERTKEIALEDPEKPLPELAASDATADATMQGAQVGAALEKMIAALPEKLREPLILSTLQEKSRRLWGLTKRQCGRESSGRARSCVRN
jgi:RNA polymerase sigma factor (sigma-70 family)